MTRQELVALWKFAETLPKGSRIYEQIKEIIIEELKKQCGLFEHYQVR